MNFAKHIVSTIFGINHDSTQVFCPENCPLVQVGQVQSHRLHCTDSSNEQQSQVLNCIIDLILIIHQNIIDNNDQIHQTQLHEFKTVRIKIQNLSKELKEILRQESSSKSKSQKTIDNSLVIPDVLLTVERIEESISKLESRINSQIKSQLNSIKNEVSTSVSKSVREGNLNNNSTLLELHSEIEGLVKEIKFDPDNPKPIELRTEDNSNRILQLNRQVIPMIKEANEAILRSNNLQDQTFEVLKQIKTKLGLDDEF